MLSGVKNVLIFSFERQPFVNSSFVNLSAMVSCETKKSSIMHLHTDSTTQTPNSPCPISLPSTIDDRGSFSPEKWSFNIAKQS